MKHFVIGLAAAALAVPASAQTAASALNGGQSAVVVQKAASVTPPQLTFVEPAAQHNIMRAGVEVPLLTREELTTKKKKLRAGQRFQMEVASNVEADGVVVIPAGTPAIGEVTEVRNKGMWGKSGYINARIISLRLGDRLVRLTGTFDDKGVTGTGGVVAAVAFVPIAGFFTTGTSAIIPSGSAVKAFLDEDIAFRAVVTQPKVLEVAMPVSSATNDAVAVSSTTVE